MPITLITGPANAGKAQVVMDAVRRHLAHGEAPLLVVPTRADAEHYLRELAGGGAAIGARVERFDGLIAEAVGRAGKGEPVLGAIAREALLSALVSRGEHARPAPGLVRALAACIAELQVGRVRPARLSAALRAWQTADGAAASASLLGEVFSEYQRALAELARVDGEQRGARALDALRRQPPLWGRTPVLFYGFDDLTPQQLDAIETLGAVVGAEVTVSLAYEPGRTAFAGRASSFQALEPLASEHRQLPARSEHYAPGARAALGHLERSLFEPEPMRVDPGVAVRLLQGGGERAELELVAREIGALLQEGVAPGEIAVVLRARAPTLDLVEEVFGAAGIPFALPRTRRFSDTALGAALIGLLRAASAQGEARDLLAWLRVPGALAVSSAGAGDGAATDRLELSVRRTGAASAAETRALWEQRRWPLARIDRMQAAAERSPEALVERAARELRRLFDAPRRGRASVLATEELDEARALAAGLRALAELRELARIAPALAPHGPLALADALEGLELAAGARPTPAAVAVLDPLALRARRVRALFLCRLQEGVFPAPPRPQPYLAEEERRRLAETSGLRLGEPQDTLAAERYLLYALASRPQQLLVLSWHVANDDGEAVARSLFVDDVRDLFDESLAERCVGRELGAVGWGELGAPRPPRTRRASGGSSCDPELLANRAGGAQGGWMWSASSLELWIRCPMAWFVERVLRPVGLDPDPEPMARGALAHAALKDTLEGLRRETGSARIRPACLALARELLERALADNERDFPLSAAPERRPGLRRRLRSDLLRYLEHAAELDSPLEPSHLELEFGFTPAEQEGPGPSLPAFDLGGGVLLRGRIDRVDVGRDGEAVLYDYKTGRVLPVAKWEGKGNIQLALYMRAVESLLGLQAVGGLYQPLRGADLRPRGVLDSDSTVELDSFKSDRLERAEVRELLARATAVAREAAAQAARGELIARPQTCTYNGEGGCMYPSICRCER